jgi:hypothetical protein
MTTKQEALELLLRKCRGWEAPHEEVRATDPADVKAQARQAWSVIRSHDPADEEAHREAWAAIGAAALYLLTDEVTVVEGRTLDEWLASNEVLSPTVRVGSTDRSATVSFPVESPVGQQMLTILNSGLLDVPRPVNGQIYREQH